MAKVSYVDDNTLLGKCYIARTYEEVRTQIIEKKKCYTRTVLKNGEVFGFEITKNQPLTQLYGFPCWVVRFVFSSVDTLHDPEQESVMELIVDELAEEMERTKGYYNIRVPAHIVDLIKAINSRLQNVMLCGGTVEQIHVGNNSAPVHKDELKLFFADREFVDRNKTLLRDMAYRSFETYQGQYHISPVTAGKAGKIYENWIASSLNEYKENTIMIAQYEDETVGYCTISENDFAVDAILSSVNENKRKLGAYKAMIAQLIQYAKSNQKQFVTSTQFDNYIVQGTWNSLGLRPFYSIYNLHVDKRM